MKRILLFGANGQVGTELRRTLSPNSDVELVCATSTGLLDADACYKADFLKPIAVGELVLQIRPDIVINAAAYTAVDQAESEPEKAFLINAESPFCIAKMCAEIGVPMIHYSTDYVFDGKSVQPYRVTDLPNPQSEYGRSKLAGENAIRSVLASHLILRTAWVYGKHGKNFLRTMLRLADQPEIRVVSDQAGCPTPAWLIAEITAEIIRQGVNGGQTHNVVTKGETTWAGFAEAIFDNALDLGIIPNRPEVIHISTSDYLTPAERPTFSVLDATSISQNFGIEVPLWQDALRTTFDRALIG